MSSSTKHITKGAYLKWLCAIKDNLDVTYNSEGTHVVHAYCCICKVNIDKTKQLYQGKIFDDVVKYGLEGTWWMLKSNFERHMNSTGHKKCKEIATGISTIPSQRTLELTIGTSEQRGINAVKPLLRIALFVALKERPFTSFADEIGLNIDNGPKIPPAYDIPEACKAMIHILADRIKEEKRMEFTKGEFNFLSWLIEGSVAAKRKLSYEEELMYIRTAPRCKPQVNLLEFATMEPYVSSNADNLFHVTLRSLLKNFKPELITSVDTDIEILLNEITPDVSKIVGAGADGASVNFGRLNGLMTKWKSSLCSWFVAIHCFAHLLQLAAQDALIGVYGPVNDFLKIFYEHFRNSPKEWSSVKKVGGINSLSIVTIPKPYGTRFVAHTKNALNAIKVNWPALILHFQNKKEIEKCEVYGLFKKVFAKL